MDIKLTTEQYTTLREIVRLYIAVHNRSLSVAVRTNATKPIAVFTARIGAAKKLEQYLLTVEVANVANHTP